MSLRAGNPAGLQISVLPGHEMLLSEQVLGNLSVLIAHRQVVPKSAESDLRAWLWLRMVNESRTTPHSGGASPHALEFSGPRVQQEEEIAALGQGAGRGCRAHLDGDPVSITHILRWGRPRVRWPSPRMMAGSSRRTSFELTPE